MYNSHWGQQLTKAEEDGNKFWRLFNRYDASSSIQYQLNDICLAQGATYIFSAKLRLHHSEDFYGGKESYNWFINFKTTDGKWRDTTIAECAKQSASDGWITCSGEFMVEKDMAESTELYLRMKLDNSRDGAKYNLDFDDISLRYHKGYVSELIVDKQDVSCWGNGVDVHVTTSAYYNNNWDLRKPPGMQFNISDIVDNGDGTATLYLNEAVTLPLISSEENSDYAAEIALITRNMIIRGDEGEEDKGGYMQVLHTPDVAQLIQGVEFQNMGRKDEVDRYVSNLFHFYVLTYFIVCIVTGNSISLFE